MFDRCEWLNEPTQWKLSPAGLAVVTDRATDFWRETGAVLGLTVGYVIKYQLDSRFVFNRMARG